MFCFYNEAHSILQYEAVYIICDPINQRVPYLNISTIKKNYFDLNFSTDIEILMLRAEHFCAID